MQVSAGTRHSLVLLGYGHVFSFGIGYGGALGHGDGAHQSTPKCIDDELWRGKRVVQVSAGEYRSFLLLEDGGVLAFGEYAGKWLLTPQLFESLRGVVAAAASRADVDADVDADRQPDAALLLRSGAVRWWLQPAE